MRKATEPLTNLSVLYPYHSNVVVGSTDKRSGWIGYFFSSTVGDEGLPRADESVPPLDPTESLSKAFPKKGTIRDLSWGLATLLPRTIGSWEFGAFPSLTTHLFRRSLSEPQAGIAAGSFTREDRNPSDRECAF